MNDNRRPDATGPDYDYSLTIEEVADRYAAAGYPRTLRTLQRYCANSHLDSQKVATATGDKYFVAPYSVSRHLAQIAEMNQFGPQGDRATIPDRPRHAETLSPQYRAGFSGATRHDAPPSHHVATDTDRQLPTNDDRARHTATDVPSPPRQGTTEPSPDVTRPDMTRPAPTDPGLSPKYVEVLERENAFLRDQIGIKDQQIGALLERDRETNFLVQGLQRMLGPLLGGPRAAETGRDEPRQ